MKKISIKLLIFGLIPMFLFSCASNSLISNGAYSDISLNQDPDQFEIKRLNEVKSKGTTLFGVPIDKNLGNKTGMVVRFNGINLFGAKRIVPALTLVGLSIATGGVLQSAFGYSDSGGYKLPLAAASVLALPISGAINNQVWGSYMAAGRSAQHLNRELVEKNQDVDVFLNPKYNINYKNGLWKTDANISLKAMGATLKVK
jgi:hypothetical protein